jgi:hypothetical protein
MSLKFIAIIAVSVSFLMSCRIDNRRLDTAAVSRQVQERKIKKATKSDILKKGAEIGKSYSESFLYCDSIEINTSCLPEGLEVQNSILFNLKKTPTGITDQSLEAILKNWQNNSVENPGLLNDSTVYFIRAVKADTALLILLHKKEIIRAI